MVLMLFISPALAWEPPKPPEVIPTFDPLNDGGTISSWIDVQNETFDLWNIITSLMNPYTDILGAWVFIILYALYIWSVYSRAGGIALVGVSLGITLPLWYTLFPQSTWYCPVIIFAIAITALFYRLIKRR